MQHEVAEAPRFAAFTFDDGYADNLTLALPLFELDVRRLDDLGVAVGVGADARAEGFGQVVPGRLALMASQVSDAFGTKTRVNPDAVWNGGFLPTKAELNILPPAKK